MTRPTSANRTMQATSASHSMTTAVFLRAREGVGGAESDGGRRWVSCDMVPSSPLRGTSPTVEGSEAVSRTGQRAGKACVAITARPPRGRRTGGHHVEHCLHAHVHPRGKDAKGKPAKIYTAEDMTQERPDLDYVQRSLKTRLKEHGVAASCLADVGAKRSGFKVKKRGCTIEVSVEGKALGKAKLDFGEPAMHGADPCAAEFEVKWYALPKASGYLLEVDAVEGDDPAMGRFTLGTTHAIFR